MSRIMCSPLEDTQTEQKVLMRETSFWQPQYSLWTVSAVKAESVTLSRDGEEDIELDRRTLRSGHLEAAWTDALPEVSEQALIAMLPMLESSRYTNHSFLMEITENDDAGNWRLRALGEQDESEGPQGPEDIRIIQDLVPGVASGTIILIRPKMTRDGEDPVVITEADVVDTKMTLDQARAVTAQTRGPFQSSVWPVGTSECFSIEIGQCQARHDEDRLIAMVYDTGTFDKPDDGYIVLHVQGAKLYWNDCLADELWGTAIDHGVWLGTDIAWHDAGEDGAEWDANWGRATIDDMIENAISFEEFSGTFEDHLERPLQRSDIKAMFGQEWDLAYRNRNDEDEGQSPDAIAEAWIKKLAQEIAHRPQPEIIKEGLETEGAVTSLYANGQLLATATVHRNQNNASILTRWVEPDLADDILSSDIARWKDAV